MKKIMSVLIALAMVLMILPMTALAATPEDLGWTINKDDFTGWTVDGESIRCDFDQCNYNKITKNVLEDPKNFVIELDMYGDRTSDPYIKVLNVAISVGGNNGNGNQIFLKVGDARGTWISARNTKVHLKIARYNGGDLSVEVTGDGSYTMIFSAPIRSKDTTVEVGTNRGIMVMENFSYRMPEEGEGPTRYPDVDMALVNSNLIPLDVNEYFTYTGNGWESGKDDVQGAWLKSSAADGADAKAIYIREKLTGKWLVNTAVAAVDGGDLTASVLFLNTNMTVTKLEEQMRLKAQYQAAGKWQLLLQKKTEEDWETLWDSGLQTITDTVLNLRLERVSDTQIGVHVLGDKGFTASATVEIPQELMNAITYSGLASENSSVAFSNFRVGATSGTDFQAAAKQTYDNLMKNFLERDKMRLVPVRHGLPSGTLTNTGKISENVNGCGEVWESAQMLMALDTYARTLDANSAEYKEVATIISNTVSGFIDFYGNNMRSAGETPNYLMDDSAWNVTALYLGYQYHKALGNEEASQTCLQYCKDLFNSIYDVFYDYTVAEGLRYSLATLGPSGYGTGVLLVGWYLHELYPEDETLYDRVMDIYNSMETYLRRPDGLYWCDMGPGQAYKGRTDLYGSEGGSCMLLSTNMGMAAIQMMMGNEEKAMQTFLGIARYESDFNGRFLNDRDAWTNTFFAGIFVREFMGSGAADGHVDRMLNATAEQILAHCVFEDGYYSASWIGPWEPSSIGWPSVGELNVDFNYDGRSPKGCGIWNDGLHVGQVPIQMNVSATTAHMVMAAALNQKYDNTSADILDMSVEGQTMWPAFNPEISSYAILGVLEDTVTIHLNPANNAVVTVNGEVVTGDSFTSRGGKLDIQVTSGDGKASKTYHLDLGEALPLLQTGIQLDTNTILVIVLVAVVAAAAVVIALELKKKNTAQK